MFSNGNITPIPVHVELAQQCHLSGAKKLSDCFKRELGFINRGMLQKAIDNNELLVGWKPSADTAEPEVVGFVHFYVRRDQLLTLYSIGVAHEYQRMGLGCRLFEALIKEARQHQKSQIQLKCPIGLTANLFYKHLGLEVIRVETGKLRPLNVWCYEVK